MTAVGIAWIWCGFMKLEGFVGNLRPIAVMLHCAIFRYGYAIIRP